MDTLIQVPESGAAWGRGRALVVTLPFLLLILATALLDLAWPAAAPRLFGTEKQEFERLERGARFSDGSLAAQITYKQRLESRTRRLLGPPYAWAALEFLRVTPEWLVLGPNEWLFLRYRTGAPELSTSDLVQGGVRLLSAFDRRLAANGVELIVASVPRKTSAVRSELPPGFDPRADIEVALGESLTRFGVNWVDLGPTLAELPAEGRYWKFDSHWTFRARHAVGRYLVERAGLTASTPGTQLVAEPAEQATSSLQMAGILPGSWAAGAFEVPADTRYRLVAGDSASRVGARRDKMHSLALAGTSFSTALAEVMAHYADQFVWNGTNQAMDFMGTLTKFLEVTADKGWPETLWYEFPLHHVFTVGSPFRKVLRRDFQRLFALLPSVPTSVIDVQQREAAPGVSFLVRPLRVISSGESIALVRLSDDGAGRGGTWRISCDDFSLDVRWSPDRAELLLPILDVRELGTAIRVSPVDSVAKGLQPRMDIVTDLDLRAGIEGQLAELREGSQDGSVGSSQSASFGSVPIERHDGILLELEARKESLPASVLVRSSAGDEARWSFDVGTSSHVLLGLGQLAGRELAAVEVRGEPGGEPIRLQRAVFARRARVEE